VPRATSAPRSPKNSIISRSTGIEKVDPGSTFGVVLGETDAVGTALGDSDGEVVLRLAHEIAKTSVESANNFIEFIMIG